MGKDSKIAWTHHTFNPWWGCTKVSAGCEHCYAEVLAKRFGVGWGPDADRRFFGENHWTEPLRWNRAAAKAGARARVFCGSMCDVFEDGTRQALAPQRKRLFDLIEMTESLDWLLLTKRPENMRDMLPSRWLANPRENVWLGATVENQAEDRRVLDLVDVPAAIRFLSMEPLIESTSLRWLPAFPENAPSVALKAGPIEANGGSVTTDHLDGLRRIDWVIVGGESGTNARPCHVEWIRSIVRQCREAGTKVFVKQLGSVPAVAPGFQAPGTRTRMHRSGLRETFVYDLRDRAGSDPLEWPDDLRVREIPKDPGERKTP